MAVREVPVDSHLAGHGVEELRNVCLWKQATAPGGALEAVFWYGSAAGDKRLYFQDDAGSVKVPRLDRNEGLSGQWSFAPGSAQAPFTLGTNAQNQKVTGLDADLLDDLHASASPTANTVAARDANGRLLVADPSQLTEVVNVQYLQAQLGALTLGAGQVTSGLVTLARGGTGADLSGASQYGLIYRDVTANNALKATNNLNGVVILAGITAPPTCVSYVPVANGGTGAGTATTALVNLGTLGALDIYGVADGRTNRRGLILNGTSGYKINGTAGVNIGTSDFTVSCMFKIDNLSSSLVTSRTLWISHSAGNNTIGLQIWSNTTANVVVFDGSGTRNDYGMGISLDNPLAAGERYHAVLSVSRAGLATLYINGQVAGLVDISDQVSLNIGSGNANVWGAGYGVNGTIYALRVYNSALSGASALALTKLGYGTSGAFLDMEIETASPAVYGTIKDRSGNGNHATLDASVTVTDRRMHTNTDTLLVSTLTANAVLYAGTGGLVSALAPNASGVAKFLTQSSSNAPGWTDLFGGTNTWSSQNTFTGVVFVNDPTAGGHPATKNYVDAVAAGGLRPLQNARAVATANISLSGTQTVDGVALIAGDVCLATGQSTASQNGLYTVASGAWTRTSDANTAGAISKGAYVFVTSGTTFGASSWYETATVTTLGTDAITFTRFFQAVAYVAGTGIALSGTTFSLNLGANLDFTGTHTLASAGGLTLKPYNTGAGNTTELRFAELTANGSNYVGFKAVDNLAGNVIWTLPAVDGSAANYLKTNGAGALSFGQVASTEINNTSFVTAVSGTANRIAVSGALTPSIDIAATYVGQTSITTLGTIATGVWNGTAIGATKGGTGQASWNAGDIVYAPSNNNLGGLSISGSVNRLLQSSGTAPVWSAFTFPAAVAVNQLLYGSGTNAVSALATVASRVFTTDASGNLGWTATLPAGLTFAGNTNDKLPKLRWFDVGDGSSTTVTLTHNFGTRDVVVQLYDAATYYTTEVAVRRTTVNTVDLEFVSAPTVNALRCAVMLAS